MQFEYKGKPTFSIPKFVSIRVWRKNDERLKKVFHQEYSLSPLIFGAEKSCDVWYRRNGEIEKAFAYKFKYDTSTKADVPIVCESYISELDEHGKVSWQKHEYEKSKRNPDTGKIETETVTDENTFDYEYSPEGKLVRAKRCTKYGSGRSYITELLYNENGVVVEQLGEHVRYRFLYGGNNNNILLSEEHYSVTKGTPNLFESGIREELMSKSKIEYNADNNQTLLMWMDSDGRITHVWRTEYDSSGNVKLRTFIREGSTYFESTQDGIRSVISGKLGINNQINIRHTIESLNNNGDVVVCRSAVSEKKFGKEEWTTKESDTMSYGYRYDDEGNWLQKDVYRNDELIYSVVRTIEYF